MNDFKVIVFSKPEYNKLFKPCAGEIFASELVENGDWYNKKMVSTGRLLIRLADPLFDVFGRTHHYPENIVAIQKNQVHYINHE